ncbi:PEP-CTERM sorting domain-containing protein [Cerasicoccus arenae]|uniref:PEP-CTERM protein-sorting domain-containing protein n=1 Tax=Cerasicoccus arenae TaxID=424488 RepID=A0A8J3DCQ0_9BACT|nr:PEP-CTERM sorting domain-containing protein [Cerasicoccus arenae]MBK1858597.1 hypothetical protein [Cerasicoccus arenae]GHC05085.1 hypothetical protein GCM10007047_22550 [Cerasicoccus arenae]
MKLISKIAFQACSLTLLASSPALSGATLNMSAIQDTTILTEGFFQELPWGGNVQLGMAANNYQAMLLRFDTSSLGSLSGATINSVSITFTAATTNAVATPGNAGNLTFSQFSAANKGWVEGTGTGDQDVTGATNPFSNKTGPFGTNEGVDWASGGNLIAGDTLLSGLDVSASYDAGSFADVVFTAGETQTYTISGVDSAALISGWLGDSDLADAGLVVSINGPGGFFGGREGSTLAFQYAYNSVQAGSGAAILTVDYTAIPEPSTYALGLGVGAFILIAMRRRSAKS